MKICFIGCLELNHFQRMIKWFAARGHDVHVVTYNTYIPDHFVIPNVTVHGVPITFSPVFKILPKKSLWAKVWAVKKIIKNISPDIVHGYFLTEFGFYTAFSGNYPKLLTMTGSDVYINWKKSKIIKFLNKASLKKVEIVISLSDNMTKELINTFKVNKSNIITRPEGVNTNVFNQSVRINKNNIQIISTRNLKTIYNIELLINAIPHILGEIPDIKIVITGEGSLKQKLVDMAHKLNLDRNVEFKGAINHDQIPSLLGSSDIYVSTSLSDGASISLFEAMACGCFPVVTDIPANRDWVEDGKNGFLVPVDDPKDLAKKIVMAINDNDLRAEAIKINWEIIKNSADIEKNMIMIEDLYFQLSKKEN